MNSSPGRELANGRKARAAATTALIFGAVLGGTLLTGSIGPAAADDQTARTIRVAARATSINDFVDIGPAGPSPGDVYVFVEDLLTADLTRVIGKAEGRCNLIDPAAGRFECTTVNTLPNGTITTDGVLVNVIGATSLGAVTGGTGQFRAARGEADVVLGEPQGPHRVAFRLTW
jgi:hypothetical protein